MKKSLLELLVCPVSKMPLKYDEDSKELICYESNLAYAIIDGIPDMRPDRARKIYEITKSK